MSARRPTGRGARALGPSGLSLSAFALAVFFVGTVADAEPAIGGEAQPATAAPSSLSVPTSAAMSARTRYEAGTEALQKRRFAEAALHFEAAATIHPHASSWFMASIAWQEAFRPERAADALAHALRLGGLDEATLARATSELTTLETTLGTVDVAAPSGWRMQIEGAPLTEAPARLHALPGARTLRIVPVDRPLFERPVQLVAGGVVSISLAVRDAEEASAAPPRVIERVVVRTEPSSLSTRKAFGAAALGLAGATIVAATVLGFSALDARDAYRTSRTRDAFDHVRYLEGWTNAAWVASAFFAVGGAALFFWPAPAAPPKDPSAAALHVGPSGAFLAGSF